VAIEGKQLGCELSAAIDGVNGVPEPLGTPVVAPMPRLKQFQIALQDLQDFVQVVCHAARQFVQRFHLLRLEQVTLRLLKQLGCAPSLGDAARDFREPDHLTIFVDGVDHDVREKLATVTPHAPAFGLEPSLASGGLQSPDGDTGRYVLGSRTVKSASQ
jgi:hypothetical protein